MEKTQKALIRQTTIFTRLNEGQVVNVKELAEEFGVTPRTIQKDFNERLSKSYNIVNLGHGNYAFAKGYTIKSAEDENIKIAISLMKTLQQSAIANMSEYIDSAIPTLKKYEEIFLFDLNFEPIEDIDSFKVILKAIEWRVGIEFRYTRKDGAIKEVTAHPYRIANFKNYWYLIAYDLEDGKIKTYHLKSIERLHILYENFIANEDIDNELREICSTIDSSWYRGGKHRVLLRATNSAKFYLERHHPHSMEFIERGKEFVLISMRYSDESEVLSVVKRWLPDIDILDNPQLEKRLDDSLRYYLERKKESSSICEPTLRIDTL